MAVFIDLWPCLLATRLSCSSEVTLEGMYVCTYLLYSMSETNVNSRSMHFMVLFLAIFADKLKAS